MSNSGKRTDYNPEQLRDTLSEQASVLYQDGYTLREISEELLLDQQKIRKLLITAGVYESQTADRIAAMRQEGKSIGDIMNETGLSRSSVSSYLPYTKGIYRAEVTSPNADRIARYRRRKAAAEHFRTGRDIQSLHQALKQFAGYPFYTQDGELFRYETVESGLQIQGKALLISWAEIDTGFGQKTGTSRSPQPSGSDIYITAVMQRLEEA